MRLIGRHHLANIADSQTESWVLHFMTEVSHATWKREVDVLDSYPKSIRLSDGTFAFPILTNSVFLHIAFSFRTATAVVLGIKDRT